MSFEAIFWDNDGVLVDTEAVFIKACREVFADEGIEISEGWFINESLAKGSSVFDLARKKGMSNEEIIQLRKRRNEYYSKVLMKHVPIVDGVKETLEALHGKFLMGVVTSSRKEHFEIMMKKTGFRRFFNFFITADDIKNTKPDPEPYLKALEIAGKPCESCLVIEDSQRGVVAAKAAGLSCYAVPSELTKSLEFSMADKVLNSIRELPDIILPTTSDFS